MRETLEGGRRSQLSRIVLVALIAGVAAGCSQGGSVRLSSPNLFAGSTAADGGVESRDLGRLAAADPAAQGASTPPIVTPSQLRQRGWSVEGAPIVEVTAADTAATLSQGFGVPVSVILEANGLSRPEQVRAGQRLVIPTYVYRDTPAEAEEPSRPETAEAGASAATGLGAPPTTLDEQRREGRHTVKSGETLFSIARANGVSSEAIARLNNLPADGTVRVGQVLRIPAASGAAPAEPRAPETQVATADPSADAGATMTDAAPEPPAATTGTDVASLPPASDPVPGRTVAEGFRWPVTGRIITGFGPQPDGGRNDGINLAVPAGTPIHASESGTVIYAGNELEGYGNLVLVQHADDWVSAYAHAESLKVKRGDRVERGQVIASVGATGAVDTPQLHFELRKRSKPVDPLPHLTGG